MLSARDRAYQLAREARQVTYFSPGVADRVMCDVAALCKRLATDVRTGRTGHML